MYLLVVIVAFAIRLYFQATKRKTFLFNGNQLAKRVLIVTSHPDDEVMFFGPIISKLKSENLTVKLLCLSWNEQRRKELISSCLVLGIECIFHSNDNTSNFIDGQDWDPKEISKVLDNVNFNFDSIFTFDYKGISQHKNHISTFQGCKQFYLEKANRSFELYTLTTVNLLRKYSSLLDIFFVFFDEEYLASPLDSLTVPFKAMLQHKSQLVWFRFLYLAFSRYMFINSYSIYKESSNLNKSKVD